LRGATEFLVVVAVLVILVGALGSYALSARRHARVPVESVAASANVGEPGGAPRDGEDGGRPADEVDAAQVSLDESAFTGTEESKQASADLSMGRQMVVMLPANDTTAYTWRCRWEPAEAMELTEDSYVPDPNPEGAAGAGGTQVYRLRAVQTGLAMVTMERAVWDESGRSVSEAPVQTWVLTVRVQ
jgi:predicted secreted protein